MAQPSSPLGLLADVIYPWRDDAALSTAARTLRGAVHLLLWGGLFTALAVVNRQIGMERLLLSPIPRLHAYWMPLLALLIYVAGWLARGLWVALREDPPVCAWPELERVWSEARLALAHTQASPAHSPVYLVLGPITPELRGMLSTVGAAAMTHGPENPIEVFAVREAIFVICSRASHLALGYADEVPWRLEQLCTFLASQRPGRPAIQGLILATPIKRDATAAERTELVRRCRRDHDIVRQATGLDAPIYFALTGLGALPNGCEKATGWFQRFPPQPDLDPADVPTMFQRGLAWLCSEHIARQLRAGLRLDPNGNDAGLLRQNFERYRCWRAIEDLQPWLVQLLTEGTQNEFDEPGMVAGCYFLASADAGAALASDLPLHQRRVSATATAHVQSREVERRAQNWSTAIVLVLLAGLTGLGVVLWRRWR